MHSWYGCYRIYSEDHNGTELFIRDIIVRLTSHATSQHDVRNRSDSEDLYELDEDDDDDHIENLAWIEETMEASEGLYCSTKKKFSALSGDHDHSEIDPSLLTSKTRASKMRSLSWMNLIDRLTEQKIRKTS